MAIRGCTSFEHGLFNTSGGGLFNTVIGTPVSDTGVVHGGGTYGLRSMKLNQPSSAAAVRVTYTAGSHPFLPSGQNVVVLRFYFRVAQLPAATVNICEIGGGGVGVRIEIDPSGNLNLRDTSSYPSEYTISTDTWYCIEIRDDRSANPWVFDWRVTPEGGSTTTMTQRSSAQAANTVSNLSLGTSSSTTYVFYYDDVLIATDASGSGADYPLGIGNGQAILPGSDGTHSFTTNDFSTGDAGTQRAPTYTDFYLMVDDAAPWSTTRSTTDNIAQRVIRTTGYVELKPSTAPTGRENANAVSALLAYSAAGTQADTMAAIVRNSGGFAGVLFGDLPSAQGGNGGALADYSESTNFFKSVLVTKPGSGWTNTEIDAIRWRVGGSGDISPVPTVQALMLEVDWPEPSGPTEYFIAAALDISLTEAIAAVREQFIAAALTINLTEAVAAIREQFVQAALDVSITDATALTREVFAAAALQLDLGMAVSITATAPTATEYFIAAALDISPGLAASAGRELNVAAALDLSPGLAAAATRELNVQVTLPVNPQISAVLTREQLIAAAMDISLGLADALSRQALVGTALPLNLAITVHLVVEGQDKVSYRTLLGVG